MQVPPHLQAAIAIVRYIIDGIKSTNVPNLAMIHRYKYTASKITRELESAKLLIWIRFKINTRSDKMERET